MPARPSTEDDMSRNSARQVKSIRQDRGVPPLDEYRRKRDPKWTDREVMFVLHGERTEGRFVLFQTGGKNWMIHRMDAPSRPDWQPLPERITPMLATLGELPEGGKNWAYEMKWDGVRALVTVE